MIEAVSLDTMSAISALAVVLPGLGIRLPFTLSSAQVSRVREAHRLAAPSRGMGIFRVRIFAHAHEVFIGELLATVDDRKRVTCYSWNTYQIVPAKLDSKYVTES